MASYPPAPPVNPYYTPPPPPVASTPYYNVPPGEDPMQPMMDPTYRPDPRSLNPGNPTLVNPYDPRNDPRNRRARLAAQNPLMSPPPPTGMRYGPAIGPPTAGFGAPIPYNPINGGGGYPGKAPMIPGPTRGYGNPSLQQQIGSPNGNPQTGISDVLRPGRINMGFRNPTGLAPGRTSYSF